MESVRRVGISVDKTLLKRFDQLIRDEGYTNRSEAIRDLIRERLSKDMMMKGEVAGTITILYNHHTGVVTDRMLHIQHHHLRIAKASTHLHINENLCLEAILVRGSYKGVEKLYNEIKSLRGILKADLSLTSLIIGS